MYIIIRYRGDVDMDSFKLLACELREEFSKEFVQLRETLTQINGWAKWHNIKTKQRILFFSFSSSELRVTLMIWLMIR